MIRLVLAVSATAILAGCAPNQPWTTDMDKGVAYQQAPAKAVEGVWTGPNGMTLYSYDRDAVGSSACVGPCAENWPPLYAPAGSQASGDWSIIQRADGRLQWAYKGHPLYYWSKDTRPGDQAGNGYANGAWRVARP